MTVNNTNPNTRHGPRRIIGFGAAACVACCAGPLLAAIGAIGLTATFTTVAFGIGGFIVLAAAVPLALRLRRRRTCALPPDGPTSVAMPVRRSAAPLQQRP